MTTTGRRESTIVTVPWLFFFQAEDGIRDLTVTGVQTCALPILAFGAPQRPGVYLFRDVHDQVLYVGKARDLRARFRSYFRSDRQRPAVEGALGALQIGRASCRERV